MPRRRTDRAVTDPSILAERRWLDSIKYTLIAAIRMLPVVGQHLYAVQGWGPPATSADTFRILAAHEVLDQDIADRMARASGFRNVLVHEYVEVRDDLVMAHLARTSDIRDFVGAIADWLA